jgi:hypothetical protein
MTPKWTPRVTNLISLQFKEYIQGQLCCGVAKLPFINNERKLRSQEPKPKLRLNQKKTKSSFSIVNFSKVDSLYKYRFVSFYREASRLFTYRYYPRMKQIETECARLIFGGLQLGLHIISALWHHAANHDAFLVVSTCTCREKTLSLFGDPPFAQYILSPKTHAKAKLRRIRRLGRRDPLSETQAVTSRVGKIHSRGFVAKKNNPPDRDPKTLNLWTYLIALLAT